MPAFFFHYNKPLSQIRKCPMLTVHYQGRCNFVKEIDCRVPVKTRNRKTQPHVVMAGNARYINFLDGAAYIA